LNHQEPEWLQLFRDMRHYLYDLRRHGGTVVKLLFVLALVQLTTLALIVYQVGLILRKW